jgi:hypothetical protein
MATHYSKLKQIFTISRVIALLKSFTLLVILALSVTTYFQVRQMQSTVLMPASEQKLEVGELIEKVHTELADAELELRKTGAPALFTVKSFDLEISFVAKAEVGGKLKLVADEAAVKSAGEKAQKIVLHLEVKQPEKFSTPPSTGEKRIGTDQIQEAQPPIKRKGSR